MFEMIRLLFLMYSGQVDFLSIIKRKYPAESQRFRLIAQAHRIAEKEFRDTSRQTGEKYIRHLESTSIIVFYVLELLCMDDPEVIVAALLHDLLEDREDWTFERLSRKFGTDIAILVRWVTKPHIKYCFGNKKIQEQKFREQLEQAPFRAILIKLADQLHNLMTLWAKSVSKQRLKVQLARDFYHPLAKKHKVLVYEFYFVLAQAELMLTFKSVTGLNPSPKFR